MMTRHEEIASIVSPEHLEKWLALDTHIYYKHGKPYGLIRYMDYEGLRFIASTSTDIDNPFTMQMVKDIRRMKKETDICLMSAAKSKHEFLKERLSRYGFTHYTEDDVLYLIGEKDNDKSI